MLPSYLEYFICRLIFAYHSELWCHLSLNCTIYYYYHLNHFGFCLTWLLIWSYRLRPPGKNLWEFLAYSGFLQAEWHNATPVAQLVASKYTEGKMFRFYVYNSYNNWVFTCDECNNSMWFCGVWRCTGSLMTWSLGSTSLRRIRCILGLTQYSSLFQTLAFCHVVFNIWNIFCDSLGDSSFCIASIC